MLKKLLLSLFCIALIITQVSCKSNEPVSDTQFMLDTFCTVEIRDMSKNQAKELIADTFEECQRYEKLFSRTLKGTDIYNINHSGGKPVEVDPQTAELIQTSLELCRQTDGLFDITVGQITNMWNFKEENPTVPLESDIKNALHSVGYEKVHVNGNTVQISDPDTWIDLGSIAKGYIADRLSDFLMEKGVSSGIVNLGGNIVAIGGKEDDTPWSIGIEAPYSDRSEIIGSLEMQNTTVVTSGTFERHFVKDGIDYHHVLDPATGYPRNTDILCVSIKSKMGNSVLCDGYSTTCLLLGKEKAMEFMKDKVGFEYCLMDKDGKIIQSDGFDLTEEEK